MEIEGLVSITIPFYNAERFLRETIESVLAQHYTMWELLLVDDGSKDRSTKIAQSYAADYPDKIFYCEHRGHSNLGPSAARNLGARHSRGEFLAFLDSDDIWLPTKLEVNVASMIERPEAGFLFGPTEYWYEWDVVGNNNQKNEVPMIAAGEVLYRPPALLARSYPLGRYGAPCPCSFLIRRCAFDRVGGFAEDFNPSTYQSYEDIAFLTKIYLCVPVFVSGACLDRNRCSQFSMTRQADTMRKSEAARRFYFRWLAGYLRLHSVADPEIWRAVRRESWFYRFPLRPAAFFRRIQGKLRREFARIRPVKSETPSAHSSAQADDRARPTGIGRHSVESITTDAALEGLEEDWNRLSESSASPNAFMTYGWFRAWLRRLTVDEGSERLQPYVLVIRRDETVVGIAPLARRVVSRFGFSVRKLEFLTHHADYNEFVVGADARALTHDAMDFLAQATDDWDFVDLRELRDDRGQLTTMEAGAARAGLPYRISPEPGGCLYMPIDAPWSETRKNKHLRFARRASLRLKELAGDGFRARTIDQPHRERDLLERIIAVEAQKEVGGTPAEPFVGAYPEVFRSLFCDLGPRGLITVIVVEKRDELIAWRILFRSGTKLWDYQTAYNRAFAELSPGTILICEAIDFGFEQECDEFDFLRGMDTYKTRWTSQFRLNQRMILWNRHWKSRFGAVAYFKLHVGRR